MSNREDFKSYIPSNKTIPELTIKAILVGILLAVILGAANAYLGLYAGMTVSAIIPGAVVALAILKPFKGTILEVNLATMGASAGECVAAGVIFTIPALILLGVWTEIHYLETTIISLLGGILGVLWMVPLRRALVVKTDLPFPEGIAVAAVLTTTVGGETAGERKKDGGISSIWLLIGALVSGLYKFGESALNIFSGTIENIVSIGKYNIFGKIREGWLYGGLTTSPALLGVGWIIGPEIASYILVGGLIGWVIITPLVLLTSGMPAGIVTPMGGFFFVWSEQIRYIGVGAMLVGGLWAIWKIKTNLADSVREAVIGIRGGQTKTTKRTDQDLSYKLVFTLIVLMTIPIFIVYMWLTSMIEFSILMAVITILFAFIASALAGYLTGLVGSSNCPISGVTVTVLLIVSLVMLILGVTSPEAMAIAIFISAVICIGGSISGDLLQSMACGHMLGATPKKLQISMTFGVIAVSLVVGPVIGILHQAYVIGSAKLSAPQAFLMKGIVKGVLGGEMLWPYIIVGMALAVVLILINLPVLPVAIGIYLPFTLSIPIFAGGVIRHFTDKMLKKKYGSKEEEISDWELAIKQTGVKPKEKVIRTGLLFTAGLVAGEALMGVFIALLFVMGIKLNVFDSAPWLPGLLVWLYIAVLLAYIPIRIVANKKK